METAFITEKIEKARETMNTTKSDDSEDRLRLDLAQNVIRCFSLVSQLSTGRTAVIAVMTCECFLLTIHCVFKMESRKHPDLHRQTGKFGYYKCLWDRVSLEVPPDMPAIVALVSTNIVEKLLRCGADLQRRDPSPRSSIP